jgi:hypothetical protein
VGTIAVTIHRLLYVLVVFFNRLIASFYRDRQLHNARLARIDELANLLSSTLEAETSLLLGVSHFPMFFVSDQPRHAQSLVIF